MEAKPRLSTDQTAFRAAEKFYRRDHKRAGLLSEEQQRDLLDFDECACHPRRTLAARHMPEDLEHEHVGGRWLREISRTEPHLYALLTRRQRSARPKADTPAFVSDRCVLGRQRGILGR